MIFAYWLAWDMTYNFYSATEFFIAMARQIRVQQISNILRSTFFTLTIASILFAISDDTRARSLEPRAYSNAPTDLNFLLIGYQNSSGALLFDPAIEITDASAEVNLAFLGYANTMDIAGKSAKVRMTLTLRIIIHRG